MHTWPLGQTGAHRHTHVNKNECSVYAAIGGEFRQKRSIYQQIYTQDGTGLKKHNFLKHFYALFMAHLQHLVEEPRKLEDRELVVIHF